MFSVGEETRILEATANPGAGAGLAAVEGEGAGRRARCTPGLGTCISLMGGNRGEQKCFHHKAGVHSSVLLYQVELSGLASRIVGPFKANSKSNSLFMETAGKELILNSYA